MQFDQLNNDLNASNNSNDGRVRPKLIKKTNMTTQKVEEIKQAAPNTATVGYDFTLNGQPLNNVEEKVAHLSLQMNQIIVRPYLQQALDYLRTSKRDSINAYNQLSDQIANEIRIISQNTQQISTSLKEAQEVVAKTQEIIRNKYNNAIEEDISSGALNLDYEYNIVAENYELSLQLTQELSKYKSRIDSLLSTQAMLDEAIVPAISRLQLEIDNLELLLQSFDSCDYAEMLAKKTGTNIQTKKVPTNDFKTRGEELNRLAAASSIDSINTFNNQNQGIDLSNMSRTAPVNEQRINTAAYNQNQQFINSINTNNNTNMMANNMQPNNMMPNNNMQSFQTNSMSNYTWTNNMANNMQQPMNNMNNMNQMNGMNMNNGFNYNSSMNSNYSWNNNMNNQQQPNQSFNNGMSFNNTFSTNMNNNNMMNNQYDQHLSKQELRLLKKLREQQMKFEHMMRMNELIFQYNRSVDEMILRQKEYELQHREQFQDANRIINEYNNMVSSSNNINQQQNVSSKKNLDDDVDLYGSKHVYETSMPVETVAENVRRSNIDKVFVVHPAGPITEDQAREIKNRGSVKSIKVVKKK